MSSDISRSQDSSKECSSVGIINFYEKVARHSGRTPGKVWHATGDRTQQADGAVDTGNRTRSRLQGKTFLIQFVSRDFEASSRARTLRGSNSLLRYARKIRQGCTMTSQASQRHENPKIFAFLPLARQVRLMRSRCCN